MTTYKGSVVITTEDSNLFANLTNVSISNAFRNIGKHFESVGQGSISEAVVVNSGLVYGSDAFTITSSNLSDGDTVTINGTTLTARTSPSLATEFKIGTYAIPTAVNLANLINSTLALSLLFVASVTQGASEAGVVTIRAKAATSTSYSVSKSATNGSWAAATFNGAAGPLSATDVFTITASNLSDEDTVTIGSTVFSAETSAGAGLPEFTIGATALATAQALAAIINSFPATATVFSAVATGTTTGIVTVTVIQPGQVGNHIPVGKSATNGSWSGTTFFTGGADANVKTLHHGL